MPPKKSTKDAADKRILLTPKTLVSTPVHKPTLAYKDLTSVMAKNPLVAQRAKMVVLMAILLKPKAKTHFIGLGPLRAILPITFAGYHVHQSLW